VYTHYTPTPTSTFITHPTFTPTPTLTTPSTRTQTSTPTPNVTHTTNLTTNIRIMNFKNHFRLLLLPLQLWLLLHRLPLQLLSQLRLLLQLQLPLQLQLLLQLEFTRWVQRPFQILLLFIFPNLKIIFIYSRHYPNLYSHSNTHNIFHPNR